MRYTHITETWLNGSSSSDTSNLNPRKYRRSQNGSKSKLTERRNRVAALSLMLKNRYLPGHVLDLFVQLKSNQCFIQ